MSQITQIKTLLSKKNLEAEELDFLLQSKANEAQLIFRKAAEIKQKYVGNYTYLRGLVELSNICGKNCYYCGIRKDNPQAERYNLTDETVVSAARFAHKMRYGSLVIQSGELTTKAFTRRITTLINKVHDATNKELGLTLSLGEQTEHVYRAWKEAGAERYLLRIESSNRDLYQSIHPNDEWHNFDRRLSALKRLQTLEYQTGTGVMIGLPGQTTLQLAEDLIFFREFDIDMVGMGPYIIHSQTPMADVQGLWPERDRFFMTLKMTALLRIIMKDINIAAATAMQAIDPAGREKALKCGANVLMPNITPPANRSNYKLYENKPCMDEMAEDCASCTEARISLAGDTIGYGQKGNSKHFYKRIDKQ